MRTAVVFHAGLVYDERAQNSGWERDVHMQQVLDTFDVHLIKKRSVAATEAAFAQRSQKILDLARLQIIPSLIQQSLR